MSWRGKRQEGIFWTSLAPFGAFVLGPTGILSQGMPGGPFNFVSNPVKFFFA
jgi:hypothetical protein